MTKPFTLLLGAYLLLALLELGAGFVADSTPRVAELTRTLFGLCGCLYLYRRCRPLGVGVVLALLVLQGWQAGVALGGAVAPSTPIYLFSA